MLGGVGLKYFSPSDRELLSANTLIPNGSKLHSESNVGSL